MSDRAALYERLPPLDTDRWWAVLAAASPGGRVLELGAGTGRLTEMLLDAGAQVTAIERDTAMVEALHRRLHDRARIVHADVTDVGAGPQVGLVVLPTALLNELPDAGARRAVLSAAAARCRPDGVVALHVLAPWWLVRLDGRVTGELTPADGGPTIEVSVDPGTFDVMTGRRRARLVYRFPDGAVLGDDVDAAVVGPDELTGALRAAGLREHRRFGARPPDPPGPDDVAWHVVAHRDVRSAGIGTNQSGTAA